MAVNLISSNDIEVSQTGSDIQLNIAETYGTYTLLGQKTGSASLNLPATFNELLVIILVASNQNVCFSITLPKDELTTSRGYNGGYYASASTNARYRVVASSTTIALNTAELNGSDVLSTSVIRVYYK